MDMQILTTLINEFKNLREISEATQKSQTTIRYWLLKYNLKTLDKKDIKYKQCSLCKTTKDIEDFYLKSNNSNLRSAYCKSCTKNAVNKCKRTFKSKCIEYKGRTMLSM